MADGEIGRQRGGDEPRHDPEAERAVLAAALLDESGERAVLARMRPIISAEDFHDPRHATIWEAICAVADRDERLDVLTLISELRARQRLNTVGGAQCIAELTDFIPTTAHCESHARIVADHALARRVERAGRRLVASALDYAKGPADLVAAAQGVLDLACARHDTAGASSMSDAVDEEMRRILADHDETVRPTGIAPLDRALCGGMREGDLVIPGGRPSSGKSAFAFQVAWNLAERGWTVVLVSLEMPRISVVQRVVAQRDGMDLGRIRARAFVGDEADRYCDAVDATRSLPLRIVDRGDVTPAELRAICLTERARAPGGRLGAVVFDYLQKGKPDRECESREQEVASIARALKSLAKELKCPVIAPAQLNRGVESRGRRGEDGDGGSDERPRMSDFRGSGEIEQEADIMIGIHRPARAPHTRELWVLKQRNGPTDGVRVDLTWDGPSARFTTAPPQPADWSDPGRDE